MVEASKGPATKRPKGGKGSAILTRVTMETRTALDIESQRTGRSISQVVEGWLDQTRDLDATGAAAASVTDAIRAMIRFAGRIYEEVGDPSETQLGRAALIAGWTHIVQNALPFTPLDPIEVDLKEKATTVAARLLELDGKIDALIASALGDPTRGRRIDDDDLGPADERADPAPSIDPAVASYLAANLPNLVDAHFNGKRADKISLHRLAYDVARRPLQADMATLEALEHGLKTMRASGPSLGDQVDDALQAVSAFRAAFADYQARTAKARKRGEALAATMAGPKI